MRFLRGLAALVALAGLLAGIPVALVIFGGNPLPDDLSAQTLMRAFFAPASDRVLLGIVAVVGWLAWAGFVLSVAAEIVNLASGRRIQLRLPGLGVGQKLAATLIVLVVAMLATPQLTPTASAAPTAPPTSSSTATAPSVPGRAAPLLTTSSGAHTHTSDGGSAASGGAAGSPVQAVTGDGEHRLPVRAEADRDPSPVAPSGTHGAKVSRVVTHEVKRGDFLWSLSERYLGDGSRWKEIARANPGVDPDQLHIGQHLRIPVPAGSTHQDGAQSTSSRAEQADTIKVERGDNLSEISEDLYGTQRHWPELYQENRDKISDPDLINPGQTLRLPERDHAARPDHKVTHHDASEASRGEHRADRAPDSTRPSPTSPQPPAEQPTTPSKTSPAAPTAPAQPVPTVAHPTAAQPTAEPPIAEPQPSAASLTPAPTAPADQGRTAGQSAPAPGAEERVTAAEVAVGSGASVGLLLAAGLVTRLALRRRRQLQMRRPGRRIVPAEADAQAFEHTVRAQHEPMRVEQLDQVLRAIAAHAHRAGTDLPALSAVRVDDQRIDLLLQTPALQPPPGIEVAADGSVWTLHASDVAAVLTVGGIDDTSPPYPALVTLGRDSATAHILIDLEAAGALSIAADDTGTAAAMLSTIALELAVSPWAADVNLTLVGPLLPGLAETLDHPSLTHIDDAARALDGLEVRATAQRRHLAGGSVGQKRADPELADAWCPHVVLIAEELDDDASARLARIVTDLPRVAVAAVTTGVPAATRWQYRLDGGGDVAHLDPHGWDLTPQLISPDDYSKILRLVASSGTEETEPAPWWDHEADPTDTVSPTPATVTTLPVPHPLAVEQESQDDQDDQDDQDEQNQDQDAGRVRAAATGGLRAHESADDDAEQSTGEDSSDEGERVETATRAAIRPTALRPALSLHTLTGPAGSGPTGLGVFGYAKANHDDASGGAGEHGDAGRDDVGSFTAGRSSAADALDLDTLGPDFTEPTLLILGPPALDAGAGQTNTRYQRRSLEVMLYLLEHPGTTSATLISRFYISRDYAKSLISALRKMLGRDPAGRLYLPELTGAGGGYTLDPVVTSDWARVQRLIGRGVNTAADENLMHVLGMVRGTPLEGAEDWVGADVLRPDMSSTISDAAHQLVDRALDRNDLELARWAAARGLVAEPESETLLVDRLRTEAQAGNRSEVARISGRIESSVRYLGGTMCEQTQEVLRAVAVYR